MGTRLGIELPPAACRIVELDGPDVVPGGWTACPEFELGSRPAIVRPPPAPTTTQMSATMSGRMRDVRWPGIVVMR